ncbi:capsule assembly Wzi family protein [bacterium]|nr:capsule assembly Wzi family protein [bacterium]
MTPNLPAGSPSYEYVEKLEALGCAFPTFRALGPQAFGDVRAALNWDPETTKCQAPEWLLDERLILLQPALSPELRSEILASPPGPTLLRGTASSIWPVFAQRENRPMLDTVFANEFYLGFQSGIRGVGYALSITPGFAGLFDLSSTWLGRFYVQEFSIKIGVGFSELTFARQARRFGQTAHGSLLFSAASAPIDALEYTLRPVLTPGLLSYLGPVEFRTWFGGQATSSGAVGAQLWGIELGMRPSRLWEIAFMELFQFGGLGTTRLGIGETLLLPFLGGGSALAGLRNTALALHTGFWFPGHFAKIYGQALLDRVGDTVPAEFSFLAGLWLPRIGRWDARFEFARTGPAAYQHPVWTQGLVYRDAPLGHPLGPDALGMYLDVALPPIALWWRGKVGFSSEARALSIVNPERRLGVMVELDRRWRFADLALQLAYQRVDSAGYAAVSEDVFAAGLRLRYSFLPNQ